MKSSNMMARLMFGPLLILLTFYTLLSSVPAAAGFKNIKILGGFTFPNMNHSNRNPYNNAMVFGQTNGTNHSNYGIETFFQFGEHKRGLSLGLGQIDMGANLKTITTTGQTRHYYEKLPYYFVKLTHDWIILENLNLGAGIYYAMPSGNAIREGQLGSTNFYAEAAISSTYKTYDYGLVAKAEGVLPMDEHWFATSTLEYRHGLFDISTIGGSTITNTALLLRFGLGYTF